MSAYGARHIPACYDDEWILNIGGATERGRYSTSSMYGNEVDLIAPCYPGNIYTTHRLLTTSDTLKYYDFSGTSAAAAHASGVAALILSYHNKPNEWYHNLSQEDVEFVLQKTAFENMQDPNNVTGYDMYTGFGVLKADDALRLIEKPKNYIRHFGTNDSSSFIRT